MLQETRGKGEDEMHGNWKTQAASGHESVYRLFILMSIFVEALFVEAPGHLPSVSSPKSGTGPSLCLA